MKSAIVSHSEDNDGCCSAAILKKNYPDAKVYLSDYPSFIDKLKSIPHVDLLLIADIGVNELTFMEFIQELKRRKDNGTEISYFDHHTISESQKRQIKDIVNYFHSDTQCASILVYQYGNNKKDFHTKVIASCGAIADYCDDEPYAANLISGLDRLFLLYETSVLAFKISDLQGYPNGSLEATVGVLSRGVYPHKLLFASEVAQSYADHSIELVESIHSKGEKESGFAVYLADSGQAPPAANFIKGIFNVPIGIAYEVQDGLAKFSFRATEDSPYDLSVIVKKIAKEMNFSGGGHPKASGAGMPVKLVPEFLERFQSEVRDVDYRAKHPYTMKDVENEELM